MSKPYFEVFPTESGKFKFRFKITNKKILFESYTEYNSKRSCLNGISSVRRNIPESHFSVYNREKGVENGELEIQGEDKTSSD